jgi:hypothetical protein
MDKLDRMSEKMSPLEIPIEFDTMNDGPVQPELPFLADLGINAASAAMMSGLNAMMKEGGASIEEWRNGKIDEVQFTYRVIHKGTNAAVKNGVRTGSALALNEGASRAIAKAWGKAFLKRVNRYNTLTAVCFGVVDQTTHTVQWFRGKLDVREYKIKSVENVGSTSGAIGGAAAGAMMGSIVPGLGTGSGALLGYVFATLGAMSGAKAARSLGEKWFPGDEDDDNDNSSSSRPSNMIDIPIGD